MTGKRKSIWVFGDYRNYYQNRVTLQFALQGGGPLPPSGCGSLRGGGGHDLEEWIMEYTAHGADRILAIDHPSLTSYSTEHYLILMEKLVRERIRTFCLSARPTSAGSLRPGSQALHTGLSADCVGWS
jgi:electron transfer flavoprotein alpha subunit